MSECPANTFSRGQHVPLEAGVPQCKLCGARLTGEEMGQVGRHRAERWAPPDWKERFWEALLDLAKSGMSFTSEDVTERIGLPRGRIGKDINNAIGAMTRRAGELGIIYKVGVRTPSQRPTSHGAALELWRGSGRRL